MKVLAIDYGSKRVGLAVGDTRLGIASPLGVLKYSSDIFGRIRELCESKGVGKVIVGFPLTMRGREGQRAEEVKRFACRLKEVLSGVEVLLFDERYSTQEALRRLGALPEKRLKELKDAHSAMVILEDYLSGPSGVIEFSCDDK